MTVATRIEFPPLPYAEDALTPVISAETLRFHHGKHHRAYVEKANKLLEEQPMEGSIEDIVRKAKGALFNNAAQAWNHSFYWKSLSPKKQAPSATLARQLDKDFGSLDRFKDQFAAAAVGQFGSGWAWLVKQDGKLQILTTPNADTPMARGATCLLTVDVWEHAYYLDYQNQRERYVKALLDERLNWAFADENFSRS